MKLQAVLKKMWVGEKAPTRQSALRVTWLLYFRMPNMFNPKENAKKKGPRPPISSKG